MRHALILAFLDGHVTAEEFGLQIEQEVTDWERDFRTKGLAYVTVSGGGHKLVEREDAKRMLEALADGRLSFLTANYLADALVMSENFEFADEAVSEAVYFVADDSRPPTRAETEAVLATLT